MSSLAEKTLDINQSYGSTALRAWKGYVTLQLWSTSTGITGFGRCNHLQHAARGQTRGVDKLLRSEWLVRSYSIGHYDWYAPMNISQSTRCLQLPMEPCNLSGFRQTKVMCAACVPSRSKSSEMHEKSLKSQASSVSKFFSQSFVGIMPGQ